MDAMLDELTPEQMNEWIAYWHVEPFGEVWSQTALLASTIHNSAMVIVSAGEPSEKSLVTPDDLMPNKPGKRSGKSTAGKRLDPKIAEIQMRQRFGG